LHLLPGEFWMEMQFAAQRDQRRDRCA
jgi:hypothetical protein